MIDGIDSSDDHDEIQSLLGVYALHATDPGETEWVDRHVRGCPRCRAEVDGFHEMAAAMGNSVEPVSAALWDRIASRMGERAGDAPNSAATVEPSFPWLTPPPAGGRAGGPAVGADAAPIADLARERHRRRRSWRRVGGGVAAAAAVIIGLLAVNLVQSNQQVDQLQSALASKGDAAGVSAALANPAHQTVPMRSPSGTQLAQLVMVPGGRGYMTGSSMPPLPKDETYQLWAVIDGQPISVGLLGNEATSAAFTLGGSASPTQLRITVEPSGGVVAPDRSPVATGTVA
ncbi:MAG TPA: anti-sigma factor [Acidimicrobiales bacterium]|nr:anti-sigma factor [Acidimicrobiales bacterium]